MAQTPDGYLWLGTEFGLQRFDGVRSVPWPPSGNEPLPDSWIRSLLAARDGTLWIGTLQGLASWKDGALTSYPELAGHSVNTLVASRDGTVWAGGYAGRAGSLCAITRAVVRCENSGFGRWVASLHEDASGTLWVTAETGLWRWRPGSPTRYALPGPTTSSSQALLQHGDGTLLVAARDGLRQIVNGRSVAVALPDRRVAFHPHRLLRDRDGGLWIGTEDRGLLHVHEGRTDVYTQGDGLSGDFITRLFEDREGTVWVATTKGLDRLRRLTVRTLSAEHGLPTAPAWSVLAARDGSIWLGTVAGVSRWHRGRVTTYRTPARDAAIVDLRELQGARSEVFASGLPDDGVGALYEDGRGRIWVSTLRGVAYFADGRFVPVTQLPSGRTTAIAGDDDGDIWILNEAHGLYRVREGTVAESIPWKAFGSQEAASALLPDRAPGGVWVGFAGRVVYLRDGTVRASHAAVSGRAGARVNDVRLDDQGSLWVSTDLGLSRIRNGRTVTLTTTNGLPCDAVHWSREDDDGSVWLYTACGLVRMSSTELTMTAADPKRRMQTTLFDAEDGVALRARPSLYRPQVTRAADGQFWFLPGDGVGVLDPRHASTNTVPPPVHVEQITADRRTYGAGSHVRLPPLIRDLEIDYTALSFVAPGKNRFRIKLEGRDREWQDVGHRRQAFYADLPPGTYRFRVAAANNSGVWNEPGAVLDFSIAPAYYQTAWFRFGCLITVVTLLWGLHRLRLRQIAHTSDLRLEERVNERMRIARELHDTLLQSFQGLMLRFQSARNLMTTCPTDAAEAMDRALDRADQAIAEGRDAIQNLRSSRVAESELAEAITTFAADLRETETGPRRRVDFRAAIEGAPRELHPLLRDEVYRIACEALRNAYRHAEASSIEADIMYGARDFRVRIRDDGKGFDPEDVAAGAARHWGLTTMRERARQIGSELNLLSRRRAGTEVELRVPGAVAYGPARREYRVRWTFSRGTVS